MVLHSIPELRLSSGGHKIPVLGLGTATFPPAPTEVVVDIVLESITLGIRHFDTAALYQSEGSLGEAIAESLRLGLIKSRDELFITSKLWCSDAHPDRVIPAIKKTLENLKLDYLDLYLVHFPVSLKPGSWGYPPKKEDLELVPFDINGVWAAMEECQTLGLTKSIGVSNFSCKKLSDLLVIAKIPPSVNQVEMNPFWQQKKLIELCKAKEIIVEAYAPLGGVGKLWGNNKVMEDQVLNEIAKAKGKSVAQICLRWAYEQGVVVVFKSYNKERLRQNLEIFDWQLTDEETKRISELPQSRINLGEGLVSADGPIKSIEELWDGEV